MLGIDRTLLQPRSQCCHIYLHRPHKFFIYSSALKQRLFVCKLQHTNAAISTLTKLFQIDMQNTLLRHAKFLMHAISSRTKRMIILSLNRSVDLKIKPAI
jgi:hypothetical protein